MIRLTKLSEATKAEKDRLYAALGGNSADLLLANLDNILDKLDDTLGDGKMYMDRKEYKKLQDLIFQLTSTYISKTPDGKQIQTAVDNVVKFYKDAVNKRTKELLTKLDSEASKLKTKIK